METKFQLLKEQKFPENLEKKLISSITDKQVTTIWYGGVYNSSYDLEVFWLRVKDKEEATKVFSKEYTKALLEDSNYHIVLLDDNDFELQNKAGRAFTKLCLGDTLLLYKDDSGYSGLICASDFGVLVPVISVKLCHSLCFD